MRILIVEDDAPLAQGLAFHLKHAGFAADVCEDGLSGLEAAWQGKYELILLDRMLPGIDGVQLLRRLRERRITTPVLMITALANIGDRVEGLDAGADDYLVKPFAVEELLARVRALGRRTPQLSEPERLRYGRITLNADRGFLQHENGASCALSRREAISGFSKLPKNREMQKWQNNRRRQPQPSPAPNPRFQPIQPPKTI